MGLTKEQPKYVPLSALAEARQRIAHLEAALRPFANAAMRMRCATRSEYDTVDVNMTVRTMRAAQQAMSKSRVS